MSEEKKKSVSVELGGDDIHITWDEPIAEPPPKPPPPAKETPDNATKATESAKSQLDLLKELANKFADKALQNPGQGSMAGAVQSGNQGQSGNQNKPDDSLKLREKWLEEAFERLTGSKPHGETVNGVSCGYGKGGSRSTKGYSCHKDSTGANQVFIHPDVSEKSQVISTLATAIAATGLKVVNKLESVDAAMPPYPQHKLAANEDKKDGIRQLKCFCPICGYTVRTSRKWIEESGAPYCPKMHTPPEMDANPSVPYVDVSASVCFVRMVVDKDAKSDQSA